MYSMKVKKDITATHIKVVVDGEVREITSMQSETVVGKNEDKEIYLKGRILRTNKIKAPSEHGIYTLKWRQNYIFVTILMLIMAYFSFTKLLVDGDYLISERILLMSVGGFLVKIFWDDLLILGRRIKIEKEEL